MWKLVIGFIGIAAHIVVGYFYLIAGLVTPLPWLIGFWILWAALLGVALSMLRRHTLWIPVVPLLALGILIGGVAFGGAVLGWSA